MTIEEFGKQIKTKYPQYKDTGDLELGQKMIDKYPQYKNLINQPSKKPIDTFLSGHSILKGISDVIGTTGLGKGIAQGIFLKYTPEGRDIEKQILAGKMNYNDLENIVGGGVTNKEIIGSTIKTGALVGGIAAKPLTALGRVGVGAVAGAGIGGGQALEENKDLGEVAIGAATGAVIGGGVSGLLEGLGLGLRKISQSKYIQSRTGSTYNKELQPPVKEVAKDIEKGFKTFGEQVANVVDDKGNPVYVGNYNTLLNKSKSEIIKKSTELKNFLSSIKNVQVNKNEVSKDIIKTMEDRYGRLTPSQIKQIGFEVSRMPTKMDLPKLLDIKRMYDNLIPESFWSKIDDPAIAFPSLVKYTLRDNARKIINEKAAQSFGLTSKELPIIQKLNNEIGIAMDVKGLSASQLAKRATRKISGEGGFLYKMVGRFIDDVLFNPAITTRSSQAIRNLGTKTGQTPLRTAIRTGTTKIITENQ